MTQPPHDEPTAPNTEALREQAALKAGEVRAKAAEAASRVQEKLPDPVKDTAARTASQARAKAAQAAQVWQDKAPEPVRVRAAQGASAARDNRGLLLAAGAVVAAWLMFRRKG